MRFDELLLMEPSPSLYVAHPNSFMLIRFLEFDKAPLPDIDSPYAMMPLTLSRMNMNAMKLT